MIQSHFSRSLSEKLLIEKGFIFGSDYYFRENTDDVKCIYDMRYRVLDSDIPLFTLEIALSKDFLSQITTAVLSASTDIAWSFTSGGYEGAEKIINKLLEEK
ncbi:MAG: hypothetical protein WC711_04290 [Candidatus Staskawiczbacteria bacterium]|jgi:hypothetical protein